MISVERITTLVEERIADSDFFIVNIEVRPTNRILVELDSDSGATIERCVAVSRHIERSLDRNVEDFELTVTSPGVDQPLRLTRQYIKNVGRKLKVQTQDGRELEGKLIGADEEAVTLFTRKREKIDGKKGKKMVEREEVIPYSTIKEAKIVVSFN